MDAFLFDSVPKFHDRFADSLHTGIQLKRFLDLSDRNVRALLDQIVDRFYVLLC